MEVVGISADSLESHLNFCRALGGCSFPLVSDEKLEASQLFGVVAEDGKRRRRAIFVIDRGGTLLHQIGWFQPGNIGQFLEIFQSVGAVQKPKKKGARTAPTARACWLIKAHRMGCAKVIANA